MFYHASPVGGLQVLEPHVSNHGKPLVYLSRKRENVLVYLSNAVEKTCRETGFAWDGPWQKWASYGFTPEGLLCLEEYYPNATEDTYRGVAGYVYSMAEAPGAADQPDIPGAAITPFPVRPDHCEYIPDAYEAIMAAVNAGQMVLRHYEDNPPQTLAWIERVTRAEYEEAAPDYRHFLEAKFSEFTG